MQRSTRQAREHAPSIVVMATLVVVMLYLLSDATGATRVVSSLLAGVATVVAAVVGLRLFGGG